MPTYEYRCPSCRREFELFQRMSDKPVAPCPDCSAQAERLISGGAGLLFRGDGFYITDYRSDAYKEKAKQEAGAGKEKADGKTGKPGSSGGSGGASGSEQGASPRAKGAKETSAPASASSQAPKGSGDSSSGGARDSRKTGRSRGSDD